MGINFQGDALQSRTVWGVMKSMEEAMKLTAKDLGVKIEVSVRDIQQKNHKLTIQFLLTEIKPKTK